MLLSVSMSVVQVVSLVGLIIIVSMIVWSRLSFLDFWRGNPVATLVLCGALGFQFGMVLVSLWYWVPADYVPDEAMIERIKTVECQSPICEGVVNDLLGRVTDK